MKDSDSSDRDAASEPDPSWYRDPEFWEVMRPFVFPEARIDAAESELDNLGDLLGLSGAPRPGDGVRVLDVPCGPGRHSVALAGRGCRVVGYDLMPAHVESARQRAAESGVDARFEVGDMYALDLQPESFDLAFNLFTSIGYSDDPKDDERFVNAVHRALRPGGAFVVDTMGKEVLARTFEPRRYHEMAGWLVHEEVEVRDAWERVVVTLRFMRDGEDRVARFSHRILAASDLARLLWRAGFSMRLYGGMDGRPYDHEAVRLVAVAVKEER